MGSLRTTRLLVTATSVVLAGPGTALAAGTPKFVVPQVTPAGAVPRDLEVADVTTDARPDALVADPATPGLGVLPGTGQGKLGPRIGSALPGSAAATVAVAVADFTNDGRPDAAVSTIDVVAPDFNGDGKQDVAAIADRVTGDSLNVALVTGPGASRHPRRTFPRSPCPTTI